MKAAGLNPLLIVPYGIETILAGLHIVGSMTLLIVPYGIETSTTSPGIPTDGTFNRTLWN